MAGERRRPSGPETRKICRGNRRDPLPELATFPRNLNRPSAELFDRAVYATRPILAGETFLGHAKEMLAQAIYSRPVLRG